MSNVSCQDFGRVVTTDISPATVARCEQKVGASLIASSKVFYALMQDNLMNPPHADTGWSLVIHAYRQDATNGRRKLSAMELDTAYVTNVSLEKELNLQWSDFRRMKRVADLLQIEDETGPGCVDVSLRGFASLGCPSWRDDLSTKILGNIIKSQLG